ncbi:hypothetical protein HY633_04995 [Candidatus Uhrbacteria bacterium]|nr:hypothetical protein [Candidatus Uhrbacteria bacterium]
MAAEIIGFPNLASEFIQKMSRSPPLAAVMVRLPAVTDQRQRLRAEQLLHQLLKRMLWYPRLTREQADIVLDHDSPPDVVADAELEVMERHENRGWRRQHERCRQIWDQAETPEIRAHVRYAAALIWRLYRFEAQAKKEAAAW